MHYARGKRRKNLLKLDAGAAQRVQWDTPLIYIKISGLTVEFSKKNKIISTRSIFNLILSIGWRGPGGRALTP